jgi:uncharacterized cupin superfamily protein
MPRPVPVAAAVIGLVMVAVVSAFAPNTAVPGQQHRRSSAAQIRRVVLVDTALRSTGDYLSSLASRPSGTSPPPPVVNNNNSQYTPAPAPEPSSAATTSSSSAVVVHTTTTTPAAAAYMSYPTTTVGKASSSALMLPSSPPPSLEMGQLEALSYASRSSFALDLLTPTGPRDSADVGQPHEASRALVEQEELGGTVSVGSWWCSEGGWPSLSPRSTTEVFHVFSGHGCLTDMDGQRHFFGPGDTVILPKGWAGRWDVQEAVHKVYCINAHPRIEDTASPIIRAVAIPFHELSAPEVLVRVLL